VIRKIVKQNTTGNFSYIPYLANFLNATLTTVYGFLLRDNFIMLINRCVCASSLGPHTAQPQHICVLADFFTQLEWVVSLILKVH
jgi:hypothetical protein